MKKWISVLFIGFLCLPLRADDIDGLIDKQKQDEDAWKDAGGELPPALLHGEKNAIRIYSPANEADHTNTMCSSVEFDELLDLEKDDSAPQETVLNTKIPRIRDSISDNCLIRPGDPILAIGPGWQELVVVKDFLVRVETPLCPNDPPYSLWVTYDGAFSEDPFFYSTQIDLPATPNGFKFIDQFPNEPMTSKYKKLLSKEFPFSDEYEVSIYSIQAKNIDRLYFVHKKAISGEDKDLASDMILSEKDGEFQMLHSEKVDPAKGTGHVLIDGFLDFNGDGLLDLLIGGDHQTCPYQEIFKGKSIGFERLSYPNRPCSC